MLLVCKTKVNLNSAKNKELVFVQSGFSNWKNALALFREHQNSYCHKLAVEYSTTIPSCGNVVEMLNETARATMEENRRCLVAIIECLQFLARQGLAFQGSTEGESNFLQLLQLRAKDRPELLVWLNRTADKYTSHEIQNELIAILASRVIQDLVSDIQKAIFFAIICDEYTDISNKEQLTICIRWVDDSLVAHEDFIGFIKIPNIMAETIVTAIKDTLARLGLSVTNCRGQCYDGASNMLGPKTGVAKRIQEVEPKAHPTHCYAHSLSLSVKDMTCNCQLLSQTMDIAKEIVTLIKFSPKRECLLQQLKENLETEDEDTSSRGIIGLCPTRWTVRASCFRRILENYAVLMEEWDVCLSERLQPDVRARIIGCKAQMERFDFFFGLHLGERLYSHTDNLSKTLQGTKMAAVSGQRLANLTKETLTKMRNDQNFDHFYANVSRKSEGLVGEPTLPRKRRAPARLEVGAGAPSYPQTAKDHLRRVYYEAIDLIVSAIDQRFNQESFTSYAQMETLLVKAANGEDYEAEFKFIQESYSLFIQVYSRIVFYELLILKKVKVSRGFSKLKEKFSLNDETVSKAFLNVRTISSETFVRSFQFKILNDITFTNHRLAKIGYVPNDLCTFCGIESETMCHLFFECHFSRIIWNELKFFWFSISGERVDLTLQDVLLGKLDTETDLLNYFITLIKVHIWTSRKHDVKPNFDLFRQIVEEKFRTEKYLALKNNTEYKFQARWLPYLNSRLRT